jgi:hypothetical protein
VFTNGETVALDYNVFDWGALLHDEVPSSPAPPPETATPTPTPPVRRWTVNVPVQGIDMEAGLTTLFVPSGNTAVHLATFGNTPTTTGPSSFFAVNGANGRITYDTAPNTLTRTVYRTLDGWAHQLGVASRTYQRFRTNRATTWPNSPQESWREFLWQPAGVRRRLYFQPSEAGKTVMVSYEYLQLDNTYRQMNNVIVPIGNELIPTPSTAFTPQGGMAAYADLPDITGLTENNTQVSAIREVRGVSVMARTAWVRGSRYSQVIARGMRPLSQVQ